MLCYSWAIKSKKKKEKLNQTKSLYLNVQQMCQKNNQQKHEGLPHTVLAVVFINL